MPKVLILDNLSDVAAEILRERGIETTVAEKLTPEILEDFHEYQGVIVRSATKVNKELLEKGENLKVVGRAGTGVNNIDKAAASRQGVIVMNTPGANAIAAAELTMGNMLALARHIPKADASMKQGRWLKKALNGVELHGKTLGVIGTGNIGALVAGRAKAFGMEVIGYDPQLTERRAKFLEIKKAATLDELYAAADFVTLHVPAVPATIRMINAESLAKMKKGVYIINCARGELVDEDALVEAINSGHVAGAALDVFSVEPPADNPLVNSDKTVCTPHLGASTRETSEKVAIAIANQMADYLLNGEIRNAVNAPTMTQEEAERLRPYVNLAKHLGGFVGQLTQGAIRQITIEYGGQVETLNIRPLTNIALKEILAPVFGESVNLINAPVFAADRGIATNESKRETRSDSVTMRVCVESDKGKREVVGKLVDQHEPRIVAVDGVKVETGLTDQMLFLQSADCPGMVGKFTTILGDSGINIADISMGRTAKNERNVTILSVDEEVPDPVLSSISDLEGMIEVRRLDFGNNGFVLGATPARRGAPMAAERRTPQQALVA